MGCDVVRLSVSQSLTNYWVDLTGVMQKAGRFTLQFRFVKRRYQQPLEVVFFLTIRCMISWTVFYSVNL